MSNVLKIKKGVEQGVNDFLKFLLESEKVKGIFTLRKMNEKGAVSYSLITHPKELKNAVPLSPLMPVNAGKILSGFTLKKAINEPIAAVLRSCELRAFIELIKRTQGSLENFLLISSTCGGVYPLKSLTDGTFKEQVSQYWESAKNAEIASDIRPTCAACEYFIPQQADMTIAIIGKNDLQQECSIFLNTKKGEEFTIGAPGNIVSEDIDTKETAKLREKRQDQKKKLFDEFEKNGFGIKALVKTFAACLSCHGCIKACPICYCTLCDFDSKTHEYLPSSHEIELEQKGGIRLPPGTIFFHIGRMIHMAVSCVNCGMCSDVCPVNIPVSTIFSKVGDSLQKLFDYLPGKDIEEPVPFGTYKEEEFTEIGE